MVACTLLLVLACGSVFVRFGTRQVVVKKFHHTGLVAQCILGDQRDLLKTEQEEKPKELQPGEVAVAWNVRYPFRKEQEGKTFAGKDVLERLQKKIQQQENKIGDWTGTNFLQYMTWVQCAKEYQKRIGRNLSVAGGYNSVTILPDGRLVRFNKRVDVSDKVRSIAAFARACELQGIKFTMVLAPSKISRSETEYSMGIDFSNQNGDEFICGLQEAGVSCLDLRDKIEEEGLDQHSLSYRTDHHWKASTGRWAAGQILSYLNATCGYSADLSLLLPERYDEEVYPSWYLGGRGRKITLAQTTPDDFSLYYPKFETSFHLQIPSYELDVQGDFSSFYNMDRMSLAEGYYKSSAYSTYAYGDCALLAAHNNRKSDGKKLLLIHDSFSDVMIPFLALGVEDFRAVDLRHFTGSLQAFIQEEKPDTVLVEYYVEELMNKEDETIKQHKAMFDFR